MKNSIVVISEILYSTLSITIFLLILNLFSEEIISEKNILYPLLILNSIKIFFIIIFLFCYCDKINKCILLEQYFIIKLFFYLSLVICESVLLNQFIRNTQETQMLTKNETEILSKNETEILSKNETEILALIILYSIDISFEVFLFVLLLILFWFYLRS